jgi:hypothetical protein
MPDYDLIAQAYLNRFKPLIDPMTTYLTEEYLDESSRLNWLKNNVKDVSFAHDPHGPAKTVPDLVDKIAKEGDPTKNSAHTQWLLNMFRHGNLKQEDLYKAHDALKDYEGTPATKNEKGERVEGQRGLKHSMSAEERQITHTRYPTIQSFQAVLAKHTAGGLPASKITENLNKWQASGRGGLEQVWDDEHARVYRIKSDEEGKAASKAIYGGGCKNGGTDWCTANHNDEHNYFDHYTKEQHPGSHLYVVHRKNDGSVFQYHTHSDQFADANDETINHEDLKTIQPSLHKMWDAKPDTLD